MARLFDAYIIAEWTAAETKKLGEGSLWIGVAKRDVRFRLYSETHNAATRAEGEKLLLSLIAEHRKRGDRVLVGLNFNFGLPAGTAARLNLTGRPWAAMGKFLSSNIVDKADNTNNRYQVAAKMNRLMTDQPWPFWGAPAKQAQKWLTTTKPPEGSAADFPDMRATDHALAKQKVQPVSVWQMHGAGGGGGHALMGIPMLRRLLDSLGTSGAVWPMGTGWRALTPDDLEPLSVLVVEVWPGLYKAPKAGEGQFKTQVQTAAAAEAIAQLDDTGALAAAFAPPKGADEAVVEAVENEEGWILGA